MESKFQIALVVLVVLAQLGGALVAAWKKRQAARARAEAGQGGGLVVLGQDSRTDSSSSTWGDPPARTNRSESSWDSDESDDLDEEYEDEEEPKAKPERPVAGQSSTERLRKSPAWSEMPAPVSPQDTPAALVQQSPPISSSRQESGVRGERSERGEKGQLAMRRNVPSRAARLLKRSTLRQAVVAQLVLAPPMSARRLRP